MLYYQNTKVFTLNNFNLSTVFPATIEIIAECDVFVNSAGQPTIQKKWLLSKDGNVMYQEDFINNNYH